MHTKECFKCNRTLAISEFYKHPRMADGHLGKCKDCTKRDVSANYAARRPQYHAYERARYQEPERKAKMAEYSKRTPLHKRRARWAVSNAVRDGRLIKLPCKCGNPKSEAHHSDYNKPLEVEWLCFSCHRAEHGQVTSSEVEVSLAPGARST